MKREGGLQPCKIGAQESNNGFETLGVSNIALSFNFVLSRKECSLCYIREFAVQGIPIFLYV